MNVLRPYPSFCVEIVGGSVYVPPIRIEFGEGRKSDADALLKALVEIGINKKQIAMENYGSHAPNLDLAVGPKAP